MKSYKLIIGEFLTSKIVYSVIKLFYPSDIFNFKKYKVDLSSTADFIKASVYWGLYERSELNKINSKLFTHLPVIELGSSLGLTSLTIQNRVKSQKHILVEANTKLIKNLEHTKALNKLTNWHIHNLAIDYSNNDYIDFEVDPGNLGSKKSCRAHKNTIEVKSASLRHIYENEINNKDFILVSDIEGAEIEIILEDYGLLKDKCKQMIIELHDTVYQGIPYTREQIAELIINKTRMKMIDTDGKTWLFEK